MVYLFCIDKNLNEFNFSQRKQLALITSLLLFVRKKHNVINLEPILRYKQEIGTQLAEKHDHEIWVSKFVISTNGQVAESSAPFWPIILSEELSVLRNKHGKKGV